MISALNHRAATRAASSFAGSLWARLATAFEEAGGGSASAMAAANWTHAGASRPTLGNSDIHLPTSALGLATRALAGSSSSSSSITMSGARFQQRAGFSSGRGGQWDNLTLPTRKAQALEASAIAQLLPNRASFFPQFTPHGVQLMPKDVLQQQQQQQQSSTKGAATTSPAPPRAAPAPPRTSVPAASSPSAAAAPRSPTAQRSRSKLHDWMAEEEEQELQQRGADAPVQLEAQDRPQARRQRLKAGRQDRRRKLQLLLLGVRASRH